MVVVPLPPCLPLSPFMISILGCSWLLLPPCLPSLFPFVISILGCSWLPLPPPCFLVAGSWAAQMLSGVYAGIIDVFNPLSLFARTLSLHVCFSPTEGCRVFFSDDFPTSPHPYQFVVAAFVCNYFSIYDFLFGLLFATTAAPPPVFEKINSMFLPLYVILMLVEKISKKQCIQSNHFKNVCLPHQPVIIFQVWFFGLLPCNRKMKKCGFCLSDLVTLFPTACG